MCTDDNNYPKIKTGDSFSEKIVFRQESLKKFAELVGDLNGIHLDKNSAERAGFSEPIVQGLVVASMLEQKLFLLSGGNIIVYREYMFIRPVFIDREYIAFYKYINLETDNVATVKYCLKDQNGKTHVKGIGKTKICLYNIERFDWNTGIQDTPPPPMHN
jgi:acyl dehydratase